MTFRDHFSRLAATYAQHRPRPPAELFDYLAEIAPRRSLAWDCGTGNGQAAVELARRFRRVVATDASREQIALAAPHERVEYRVEPAERSTLADGVVDLVTVAVAAHWFDLGRFYDEVRRVMGRSGVIAVWTYYLPQIAPDVDVVLEHLTSRVLGPYWPEGFHHLSDCYRSLPFPFAELEPPRFEMTASWSLDELAGFLGTWSAMGRYLDAEGEGGFGAVWTDLASAWGTAVIRRPIHWPIYLRVGRVI